MADSHPPSEQLDPGQILDAERFMDYERSVVASPLLRALVEHVDRPDLEICDVGGASGRFLLELSRRSPHRFRGTVLEVNEQYRQHLADPSLSFLRGSVVGSDLPVERFDIVTFRHLLHHLVGDSIAGTLELQGRALGAMMRLVRPGGLLAFQEQIHYVRPFSRLVYHLSKLANRFRIHWRYFETGKVVISFLTPEELHGLVAQSADRHGMVCLHRGDARRKVELRWRLTLLMSRVGDALYLLRKPPATG